MRSTHAAPLFFVLLAVPAFAQLPAPPAPVENPITPEKALLGKVLFWEEQLSSDDTVACGTCHIPSADGGESRSEGLRHPGPDGLFFTRDDAFGSPGVTRTDAEGNYRPDALVGVSVQRTGRQTPSFIGAQYAGELFWDGRAGRTFVDPQTGRVSIQDGGALENQAVGPPTSDVEMAHEGRDWDQIVEKLREARPLVLARELTPDLASVLATHRNYGSLFEMAFGDQEITSERVAFAIATYERTLVPDQTAFDAFAGGDTTALTIDQQLGLGTFLTNARCVFCHSPPLFDDGAFHNLGLRPSTEDVGRASVTGDSLDNGKFKTPGLRNVGLRDRFFHNGSMTSLEEVVDFYDVGGFFSDNRDFLMVPLGLTQFEKDTLVDFMRNGLTDPRVANELPPFDRPVLRSETRPRNPRVIGGGSPGSGEFTPLMIARTPPLAGSGVFRIGVGRGLGGARALLVLEATRPGDRLRGGGRFREGGGLPGIPSVVEVVLEGSGPGGGYATVHLPIPARRALRGVRLRARWIVMDPGAPGGRALSASAFFEIF